MTYKSGRGFREPTSPVFQVEGQSLTGGFLSLLFTGNYPDAEKNRDICQLYWLCLMLQVLCSIFARGIQGWMETGLGLDMSSDI